MAKILCVYDEGSAVDTPLIGAKGTAFIVESEGRRILFDTGLRDRYLEHNLEHLEIDPASVEAVVVSQRHPDNCRGINGFLDMREGPVDVVAPAGLYDGKRGLLSNSVGLSDENREKARLRSPAGWEEIIPDVWISPALGSDGYTEFFLVLKGDHIAILSGRGHEGPGEILAAAKGRFGMEPRVFVGSILLEKKKKPLAEAYASELEAYGSTGLHLNHCTGRDGMTNMRAHFGLNGVDDFYAGMTLDLRLRRAG